jgi:hypothetical protein
LDLIKTRCCNKWTGSLGNNAKAFKEDVLAMSGVKSGTLSFFLACYIISKK